MRLVCDRHRYHIYFSSNFPKKNSVASISNFCCMFDIFCFTIFLSFVFIWCCDVFSTKFSNAIEEKKTIATVCALLVNYSAALVRKKRKKCGYNTLDLLFFSSFEHTGIYTNTYTIYAISLHAMVKWFRFFFHLFWLSRWLNT